MLKSSYRARRRIADGSRCAAGVLLLLTVVASPWAFGGVLASAQYWIFAAMSLSALAWVVAIVADPLERPRFPLAFRGLAIIALLGVVQLLPLSPSLASTLSPRAVEIRKELLPEPGGVEAQLEESVLGEVVVTAESVPLSLYPRATRRQLTLWILAAAGLLLSANLFQARWMRIALLVAMAANGAALAAFGIVQKLTFNGMVYWVVPLTHGGSPFGPFVNRNSGAGYLLIALGAAIAMLWIAREQSEGETSLEPVGDGVFAPRRRTYGRLGGRSLLEAGVLWSVAAIVLMTTGVLISLSRGGTSALLVAAFVLLLVELGTRRERYAAAWFVVFLALAIGLLAWAGLSEDVQARLATIFDDETVRGNARWAAWSAAWDATSDFSARGSGLGTYQYVYPVYIHEYFRSTFEYAENLYIQVMVEAGVVGLVALATFFLSIALGAWRLLTNRRSSLDVAAALGALFALVGVMFASLADFGLYLPANLLAFTVLSGLVFNNDGDRDAEETPSGGAKPFPAASAARYAIGVALAVLMTVSLVWSQRDASRAVSAENALRLERAIDPDGRNRRPEDVEREITNLQRMLVQSPNDTPARDRLQRLRAGVPDSDAVAEAITQLQLAAESSPDDAIVHERLGRLLLVAYRLRVYDALIADGNLPPEVAWRRTAPSNLHAVLHQLKQVDALAGLNAIRSQPEIAEIYPPAFAELIRARSDCCLLPRTHILLALLAPAILDEDIESACLERARRLDPVDARTLFEIGALEHQAGHIDGAYASWKLALTIAPTSVGDVLRFLGDDVTRPEIVAKSLPDIPEMLVDLAETKFRAEAEAPKRESLARRALQLLESGSDMPQDEQAYVAGRAHLALAETDLAIQNLGRAVNLRPMEHAWQYRLATLLFERGDLDRAYAHALRCVRSEPSNDRYRRLLEQVEEGRLKETSTPRGNGTDAAPTDRESP